jgi:hypothetical protein
MINGIFHVFLAGNLKFETGERGEKKGVETAEPKLAIRDPYIFEFLGLRSKDAVSESVS